MRQRPQVQIHTHTHTHKRTHTHLGVVRLEGDALLGVVHALLKVVGLDRRETAVRVQNVQLAALGKGACFGSEGQKKRGPDVSTGVGAKRKREERERERVCVCVCGWVQFLDNQKISSFALLLRNSPSCPLPHVPSNTRTDTIDADTSSQEREAEESSHKPPAAPHRDARRIKKVQGTPKNYIKTNLRRGRRKRVEGPDMSTERREEESRGPDMTPAGKMRLLDKRTISYTSHTRVDVDALGVDAAGRRIVALLEGRVTLVLDLLNLQMGA